MGEQKYKAKGKKVNRMSRDGLAEENLATKDRKKVTEREADLSFKKSEEEQSFVGEKGDSGKKSRKGIDGNRLKQPDEGSPPEEQEAANSPPGKELDAENSGYRHGSRSSGYSHESAMAVRERKAKHRNHYYNQKQIKQGKLQFDKMETDGSLNRKNREAAEKGAAEPEKSSQRLRQAEDKAKKSAEKLQHAKKRQIRKKSIQMQRVKNEEIQSVKYKLHFEEKPANWKPDAAVKKAGVRMKDTAGNLLHGKIRQDEQDNSAVQSVHGVELAGETIFRQHSNRNYRKQRKQQRKIDRMERKVYRTTTSYQYRKYLEEHPQIQRKMLQRMWQKQRIKREYQKAYRAGKIAKESKDTAIKTVNVATKVARKLQEIVVRNMTAIFSAGLLLLLLLFVMAGFSSCSAMFSDGVSTVIASSYLSEPDEIEKVELYYTEMEAKLQQKINQMEAEYPGKDEYRYNIGAIDHDPHTLISYLTAKYGEFTFDEVKEELDSLFAAQYGITVEEKAETRTETTTVQVGQSLGNVVTSGYCNCPICCGIWSGGPTASGAMPQANHTIAVDAANPFLPMEQRLL